VSNENQELPEDAADRAHKVMWYPIGAVDSADGTDAEKVDSDRLDQPDAVAGLRDSDPDLATDADKIDADGLEQPSSVAGLTNLDDGLATDAQKIDADGLD
jgi:hypothetical protein